MFLLNTSFSLYDFRWARARQCQSLSIYAISVQASSFFNCFETHFESTAFICLVHRACSTGKRYIPNFAQKSCCVQQIALRTCAIKTLLLQGHSYTNLNDPLIIQEALTSALDLAASSPVWQYARCVGWGMLLQRCTFHRNARPVKSPKQEIKLRRRFYIFIIITMVLLALASFEIDSCRAWEGVTYSPSRKQCALTKLIRTVYIESSLRIYTQLAVITYSWDERDALIGRIS